MTKRQSTVNAEQAIRDPHLIRDIDPGSIRNTQTFRVTIEVHGKAMSIPDVRQAVWRTLEPSGILDGGRIVKVTQTRGRREHIIKGVNDREEP